MALGVSSIFSTVLMKNNLSYSSSAELPTWKVTCQPWLLHVLPDETQGLALKDLENWIFMHTWLGGRKKTLPAVSVTQTKALGSNRPQLLDLDLCFLSLDKAQAITFMFKDEGLKTLMYGGGHAYILVSWKVYIRSQILYIVLASLTLPSFVFGDQGEYISSCLFYLLSVLRGSLFSIHTA